MGISFQRRRVFEVATAVAGVVCLAPLRASLRLPGLAMDEGGLLLYPKLVSRGLHPHRDFETFYGPANPYMLNGIFHVAGASLTVERLTGAAYSLGVVVAVGFAVARFGRWPALWAAVAAGLALWIEGTPAYAATAGLALVITGLALLDRKRPVLGGLALGLALVFHPDFVLAAGGVLLAAWIGKSGVFRIRSLVGAVAGAAPLLVHVVVVGLPTAWRGMVADPVRQSAGRRLPLPPTALTSKLLFVALLAGLVVVGVGALVDRGPLLVGALLASVGLLPSALQRADAVHLRVPAIVAVAFAIPAAKALRRRPADRRAWSLAGLAGVACAGLASVAMVLGAARPTGAEALHSMGLGQHPVAFVRHDGRSFPLERADEARSLMRLLDRADALGKPGDRLFVGPEDLRRTNYNDAFIYWLLPRFRPATYYIEMNPLSANWNGRRLAEDVGRADVVILTSRWDDWHEPNRSRERRSDAANHVLTKRFCLRSEAAPWQLLQRCG